MSQFLSFFPKIWSRSSFDLDPILSCNALILTRKITKNTYIIVMGRVSENPTWPESFLLTRTQPEKTWIWKKYVLFSKYTWSFHSKSQTKIFSLKFFNFFFLFFKKFLEKKPNLNLKKYFKIWPDPTLKKISIPKPDIWQPNPSLIHWLLIKNFQKK